MKTTWIRPNIKGVLLYLTIVVIAINFMPVTTTITYSLTDGKQITSEPWLWMGLSATVMLLLYPFSMWIGNRMPHQGTARLLTGPVMIIPQTLIVAVAVGMFIYEPPEIHRHLERHLFLQGSTDWGGGCLFAGTIALYVAFGFTSAWYLVLRLQETKAASSFLHMLGRSLWMLKFHIAAFVIGGAMNISYDIRVTPNDFRDMFLLMCLVYGMSVILISALASSRLSMAGKLTMAPMFTVLWLIIGSDGNTARAGQLVQSGQDPQPVIRGYRHGIMMSWHHLCDSTFGDVGGPGTTTLRVRRARTQVQFLMGLLEPQWGRERF